MIRTRVVLSLAVLWITGFALLDLIESRVTFFGSLSIATVAVAIFCPPRWVAATAVYAIGWSVFIGVDGERWNSLHLLRIGIALVVTTGAVLLAIGRERRERSMARMTNVALVAQRALLRPISGQLGNTRLAARYVSAAEDALVGGDFYEATETPFGTRIIVGDVVGRGLEAVDLSALVLGGFREAALSAQDLPALGRRLDAVVAAFAKRDEYATAILAELGDGKIRLSSCGHPMPLIVQSDGTTRFLDLPTTLPLGYGSTPQQATFDLKPGDRVLLYTDGITEGRAPEGPFFDLAKHASGALRTVSLEAALDELLSRLDEHLDGGLQDDVALVLVEPVLAGSAR